MPDDGKPPVEPGTPAPQDAPPVDDKNKPADTPPDAGKPEVSPELRKTRDEAAKRRVENKKLTKEAEEKDALILKLSKALKAIGVDPDGGGDDLDATAKKFEQEKAEMKAQLETVIVQSAYATIALKKGIADPLLTFKLLDMSSLTIDTEKNSVIGLEDAVDELIKAAPWVLGKPEETTPAPEVPGPGSPKATAPGTPTNTKNQEAFDKAAKTGGVKGAVEFMRARRENA